MFAYTFQRLLGAVPTFLGITLLTFALLRWAPGDPLLGQGEGEAGAGMQDEALSALHRAQGMDRSFVVLYGEWLGRVVRLDFGRSFKDARPVREKILEAAPRTLALTGTALLLALLLAVPFGTWAAARRGSMKDRALELGTLVLQSLPTFWVGVMLLEWLATSQGWALFPLRGLRSDDHGALGPVERIADVLWHAALPVACLTYGAFALLCRQVRSGVSDVLRDEPWIQAVRAKGLPERRVLFRHALGPVWLTVVTYLGLALPRLIGGSVVIEQIFGIPGMGLLALDALLARDHPTVLGITTCVALLALVGTVLADIATAWRDPRVRLERGEQESKGGALP